LLAQCKHQCALFCAAFYFYSFATLGLVIGDNIIKNVFVITTAVSMQWLVATGTYYFFTETYAKTGWSDFPTYVAHWSIAEISVIL
jgi:hypothetical protein